MFCEETMRLLANEIRKSNSFDWLKDLDRCVNDLLSLSELDSINKARCKKHFEDIVIYQIKSYFRKGMVLIAWEISMTMLIV